MRTRRWWRERFVTLMVIPERTRRVHKVVVPFVALKLGVVLVSLTVVFLLVLGIDYIHVLGRISENKQLKGENFKLRQEIQVIRNKVESMESTIERVRNYAKKLQVLTGQGGSGAKGEAEIPWGPADQDLEREPAVKRDKRSESVRPKEGVALASLESRVESLQNFSLVAERYLSRLQLEMLAQSALIAATPSLLPIVGWISSAFGYRRHPYDGSFRMHAGIDIAAEPGTPVRAPADGMIIFSGYREGYGKVLVIDHGYGIRTLFAHNSKLFATAGGRVHRGETISEVGSTGHSTGPHLHYEVRKNGVAVNPTAFFSRTRF